MNPERQPRTAQLSRASENRSSRGNEAHSFRQERRKGRDSEAALLLRINFSESRSKRALPWVPRTSQISSTYMSAGKCEIVSQRCPIRVVVESWVRGRRTGERGWMMEEGGWRGRRSEVRRQDET